MRTRIKLMLVRLGLLVIGGLVGTKLLVAQEQTTLSTIATKPLFVAVNVWHSMAVSNLTSNGVGQDPDPVSSLDDDPQIQSVFDELIQKSTTTTVRTEARTRDVQTTVLECRRVCIRGRWRWCLVPVVVTRQETYTVQQQVKSVALAGLNWTSGDPDVGAKTKTLKLETVPKSAGGRATRISEAARGQFSSAIQQRLKDQTGANDTVLALASDDFLTLGSADGTQQAYVIRARVSGGALDRVDVEVLLKEKDRNGTPSQNKDDLEAKAEKIAAEIVSRLK